MPPVPEGLTPDLLEQEILQRTEAIWLEEPVDLQRMVRGVVDSGAGAYGQYFTTLLFAQSEVRGLAYNATTAILSLSEDPGFDLEQLKKMAHAHMTGRAGFLNYIGMHEIGSLYLAFLGLLDQINDHDTFVRLTSALRTYGVRLHIWTEHFFPWHLGAHMLQQTDASTTSLLADVQQGRWTPVPYLTS